METSAIHEMFNPCVHTSNEKHLHMEVEDVRYKIQTRTGNVPILH